MSEAIPIEVGRPCPRPCVDCPERRHHWWIECVWFEEAEERNDPALADYVRAWPWPEDGSVLILICRHCEVWRPISDDWEE